MERFKRKCEHTMHIVGKGKEDCSACDFGPMHERPLESIRVLFRDADSLDLWGIPYDMRPGQGPKDIARAFREDWIWLGTPGWYYDMPKARQEEVRAFLAKHAASVPMGPYEWSRV